MISDAMGWKLDRIEDDVAPKMADQAVAKRTAVSGGGASVRSHPDWRGFANDVPPVTLRLDAYLGAPDSYDWVLIGGSPRIFSKIDAVCMATLPPRRSPSTPFPPC